MTTILLALCLCRALPPVAQPPRSMRAPSALSVQKTNAELRERERRVLQIGR